MPSHTSNNPTPSTNQDSPQPFGSEHCEDHREDLHEDAGVEGYFEPGSLDTGLSEPADEGPYTVEYQGAARVVGYGKTALDLFNEDRFSDHRRLNLYYPWASKGEWEVAQYLLKSSLSLADIDEFLKLELVEKMNLSFKTAKELRSRADLLPAVPQWKYRVIPAQPGFPSKNPLVLYYRDAVECLQHILRNPLIQDSLKFTPLQIFNTAAKTMRVYESWLSGNRAWSMQSQIPAGAALLGTILSSDKTTISVITGNRVAHPLLISLANIDSEVLSKASNHLFNLLALIPIPRYMHSKREVNGVCENRLYHQSLDIVLEPLKKAASIGVMMADPVGQVRLCYTPCASFIVDTPEASLIAYDIESYWQVAQKARTNGVVDPFWRDWPLAEPCEFLTPEPLHHWHKMFFDHDLQWGIQAAGPHELDFRYSLLQPRVGFRKFPDGISTLKQVTGKTHRDIQRSLIPLIAGAVSSQFLVSLRALMDFRYSGKARRFNDNTSGRLQLALDEFHDHKGEIIDIGARVNSKGQPIDNWHIPKLEFMQSVVPSIAASGPVSQWSADVTEHAHITQVKEPARAGNNKDYEAQIVRHLDMHSRLRSFDLMTCMKESKVDLRVDGDEGLPDDEARCTLLSSSAQLVAHLTSGSKFGGAKRRKADLFYRSLSVAQNPNALLPHRTFTDSSGCTAFHLVRDPDQKTLNLDHAAALFHLPDFVGSLRDYLDRFSEGRETFTVGGRRGGGLNSNLPFSQIKVWSKVVLQGRQYFNADLVTDPYTILALPPDEKWVYGRQDCAIINVDPSECWPRSSMNGHSVVAVKMIFTVSQPKKPARPIPGTHQFLAYCERFDVVAQEPPPPEYAHLPLFNAWNNHSPDYFTGCYVLKRARRSNGEPFGDIIPLTQFRALADLIPHFRNKADRRLSSFTSFHLKDEFFFNKYFDHEIYHTLEHTESV
ncbi:hypothetical protein BT96DRAFT_844117 [Gymnopus androsaceus JB14]|uniref:DUF6830 domain-containing protein n=1 Tax=Gymnopus androsaceus JB14 TaxID=1447944 RepID=A0A6A4GD18_9AGAR|nr:hypothetical protein BT96DRAFT_844117 [Gymnopus androsaceus JB14]